MIGIAIGGVKHISTTTTILHVLIIFIIVILCGISNAALVLVVRAVRIRG